MSYRIKITTTKPNGTPWFYESGTPNAATILADIITWNKAQPGYVSGFGVHVGNNIYEHTIIFDSALNGDAWLLAKQTEPNNMIRDAYLAGLPVRQDIVIT